MRAGVTVLMVALFVASYLVIVQPARFPSEEEIIIYHDGMWVEDISPDIKEEGNQYILYRDDRYCLYIDGTYVSDIDEEFLDYPQFNNIPIYGGK